MKPASEREWIFWMAGTLGALLVWFAADTSGMGRPPSRPSDRELVPFDSIVEQARALASKPFEPPREAPAPLRDMGYDQWRDIRFRKDHALWRGARTLFTVEFFHPGFLYKNPVRVNAVDETGSHPVAFAPDLFDYGQSGMGDKVPGDLGFAGFRIHYPLNRPGYSDEFVVFLGASYFRAVPQGHHYGLSARGLAINTATDEGEEFPFFREFWIEKPAPRARHITVGALLDSPSLAGAFYFVIHPGKTTVMEVNAVLWMRKPVKKLGLAPVSSMFFSGENQRRPEDFRPEVHDSDGLLIAGKSGEWIWRPLVDPRRLRINNFSTGVPSGFGLLQRDKNFDHYQDLETRYEQRPSLWIVPGEGWGEGTVEIVEIPSPNEYNDNIAAYWALKESPNAGASVRYSYRLEWCADGVRAPAPARVMATRIAQIPPGDDVRFVIDFEGGELHSITNANQLKADIHVEDGYRLQQHNLIHNDVTGGWRLTFRLVPVSRDVLREKLLPGTVPPVHLRAVVKRNGRPVTETWDYSYPP